LGPVGLVLAAAMLWGTTGTAQHFAPAQLSPYWVGGLRMVMAALFFVALALLLDRGHARQPMRWARIVFCGLCMAIYNLSFFAGVKASGVALGTALAIGSGPIWAGLMQAVVQSACPALNGGWAPAPAWAEALSWRWPPPTDSICHGRAWPCVCWPVCPMPPTRWSTRHWCCRRVATVNAWVFACAALLSLPVSAWLGGPLQISAGGWAVVIYLGMVATGFAYLLFSVGLRGMSAATGVALSKAEPITAFALSLLVVGERPAWWSVIGLLGVIGGLWLVVQAERKTAETV
jgi:DME family drug/metabolite transporter